jgi:hypothetical protein
VLRTSEQLNVMLPTDLTWDEPLSPDAVCRVNRGREDPQDREQGKGDTTPDHEVADYAPNARVFAIHFYLDPPMPR